MTRSAWAALAVAATAIGLGLWLRPPMPPDELRWLAVAWEMHRSGDWLVPTLDGQPYAHKPPLLFWLINAGWTAFGPVAWWPRLVAPLAALAGLALAMRLGRRLDEATAPPGAPRRDGGDIAPWLLAGGWAWLAFAGLTFVDHLLVAGVLIAVLAQVRAARGGRGIAGGAIGSAIALLGKGPVAFLFIIPAAAAVAWQLVPAGRRRGWAVRIAIGLGIGCAVAAAWAIPAAIAGGREYAQDIFWDQHAGRASDSFAHASGAWFYIAILPGLLLPWLLWPPAWRAVRRLDWRDPATRVLAAWAGGSLAVLTVISGKQPHYLAPLMPVLALLAARAPWPAAAARDAAPLATLLVVLGLGWVMVATLPGAAVPPWLRPVPWWPGLAVAALAAGLLLRPGAVAVALTSAALVILAQIAAAPALRRAFDPTPVAQQVAALHAAGRPVAWVGASHGELTWPGGLQRPLELISEEALWLWCRRHPDGAVVFRSRAASPFFAAPQVEVHWRGSNMLRLHAAADLRSGRGWHPPMIWPPFPPVPPPGTRPP